ncbi:MAG: tRNA (adenosine(37)-N6)-dimethylallyltransferase MiaA, partial [Lachnospiraceae bacterium]|nr:tRNA (adenosine(37)-N6)-dimethylallyltransferase MiaA [Lachnospiraceae bacterium]
YERIDRRVDEMMEEGLLNEVMRLKEMGYTPGLVSMQGLGYKELMQHLEGAYDLPRAVSLIKQKTRHYAKRQMTWFRRERDVIFIEKAGRTTEELVRELMKYITDFKTT